MHGRLGEQRKEYDILRTYARPAGRACVRAQYIVFLPLLSKPAVHGSSREGGAGRRRWIAKYFRRGNPRQAAAAAATSLPGAGIDKGEESSARLGSAGR